ncbi:MAG: MBL fold metallo-hydrolase [Bacteroidia bacterium]
MIVKQFEDKPLAQFGYAILSEGEMAVIDPARDIRPYVELAEATKSRIVAIFETHPHADFASGHRELHQKTGAPIYVSKLLGAHYEHHPLEDGQEIQVGKGRIRALFTSGHSPDSTTFVAIDEEGNEYALFTGDWLFIGDVGRADLREKAGNIQKFREDQARDMYHSLRRYIPTFKDEVLVFPAHGAGTLCGKALKSLTVSTIGAEKIDNWAVRLALQGSEEEFIKALTTGQPHIPKYFPNSVEVNRKGAPPLMEAIAHIPTLGYIRSAEDAQKIDRNVIIVDGRPAMLYRQGHLKGSINIPAGNSFDTWLGSIVAPKEVFYLVAQSPQAAEKLLLRVAAIGYEESVKGVIYLDGSYKEAIGPNFFDNPLSLHHNGNQYIVVDVRDPEEVAADEILPHSLKIRLAELRERLHEIPTDKKVVFHCAGGLRSAIAASILHAAQPTREIYDVGEAIAALT